MNMGTNQGKISLFLGVLLASALASAGTVRGPQIGDKAPDFTLPSTNGQKINLSQFRGKKLVLLEFYVADFGAT